MPRLRGHIDSDGAVVEVLVTLDQHQEDFFRQAGRDIPEPFATTALIDTGASRSAVSPWVVKYLGSIEGGVTPVTVPGDDGKEMEKRLPVHDLRISLVPYPKRFDVQAVVAQPATTTVLVLIGRDILDRCTFLYDGEDRNFSLWF
jgi:hypothetical protein